MRQEKGAQEGEGEEREGREWQRRRKKRKEGKEGEEETQVKERERGKEEVWIRLLMSLSRH